MSRLDRISSGSNGPSRGAVDMGSIMKSSGTHCLLVLWAAAISAGVYVIHLYSFTSAEVVAAAEKWPAVNELPVAPGTATLVIFVHPGCPCTRASVKELSRIMTRCEGKVSTFVVLLKYDGMADDLGKTDISDAASAIPGVRVVADERHEMAERFGASCSGETFLYDVNGRLAFQGGITPSRGHSGDSAGQDAVVSMLTGGAIHPTRTPVYGCSLNNRLAENRRRSQ